MAPLTSSLAPLLAERDVRRAAGTSPSCHLLPLARSPATRAQAGFTLTEVMVVLVMLGVLAALAVPSLGRDKASLQGRGFARTLARDLQRARMEAIAERLPLYLFVFQDRIEMRSAVPGARPTEPPRAPTLADPVLRVVPAPDGVTVMDVKPAASAPASAVLVSGTHRTIEVNARGQAQLLGQPPLSPAFIYVQNSRVAAAHPDYRLRVDVVPLTASVSVRDRWN